MLLSGVIRRLFSVLFSKHFLSVSREPGLARDGCHHVSVCPSIYSTSTQWGGSPQGWGRQGPCLTELSYCVFPVAPDKITANQVA